MTRETAGRTIVVGYDGSAAAHATVDRATGPSRTRPGHPGRSRRRCVREFERAVAVGPAAPAIIRAADVHHADEIIIGSRGVSRVRALGVSRVRALLGSVAHDVIHRARCPVTVIPERMVDRDEASAEVVEALA